MENQKPIPQVGPVAESWSTLGKRLSEEIGALRETSGRLHELFAEAIARSREDLKAGFKSFASDTQRAFQRMRQELQGERRLSLALLSELLEIGLDLDHLVAARPPAEDGKTLASWAQSVAVEARKVRSALEHHGIHSYDAVVGSVYDPALHERVGARHVEGTPAGRVLEQHAGGYASSQPDFVLRRPKVIVSE
jgi:molecular chaperone GrpE (heat shock protein)